MAKASASVLFSNIRGSIGNITVTQNKKNEVIIRQKATRVTNPNTLAQQKQRKPFGVLATMGAKTPLTIERGWKFIAGDDPDVTPRGRFMSNSLLNCVNDGVLDVNAIIFGRGDLIAPAGTGFDIVVDATEMTVTGNLIANASGISKATDLVFVAAVNANTGAFEIISFVTRTASDIGKIIPSNYLDKGLWMLVAGAITADESARYSGSNAQRFISALTEYHPDDLNSPFIVLASYSYE